MRLSAPIHHLKRKARLMSRREDIPLHAALDRVATAEGFRSWSLLVRRLPPPVSATAFLAALEPGDLALVGARPGQGKTVLGLTLAVEATRAGRRATFFTLEYSDREVRARLDTICAGRMDALPTIDRSDAICADHIVASLADAPAFAVVDYLQLLDQRRDRPPLMDQLVSLKAFARERGHVVVMLSQIDRAYDPAVKPCPDLADVRRPNPVDLTLFDKALFIQDGRMRMIAA